MSTKLRIFIAYSLDDDFDKDRGTVLGIINHFRKIKGLKVFWDGVLPPGKEFGERLKDFIAYSHVIVPIISEKSLISGWVHQEVGYAVAMNIPVLPIALENLSPVGLIDNLQAIYWNESQNKKKIFSINLFHELIDEHDNKNAPFTFTREREERDAKIIQYTSLVGKLGKRNYGYLRNIGALSFCAIPDEIETAEVWQSFYGNATNHKRIRLGREERQELEIHALGAGFSLIINPEIIYDKEYGIGKLSRLRSLLNFLKNVQATNDKRNPNSRIKALIAFDSRLSMREHLTIIGDYFYAETLSAQARAGLRNTLFTRNAHVVKNKMEEFDEKLLLQLNKFDIQPEYSLKLSIKVINKFIENPDAKLIEVMKNITH